jgi:hypothetical protein
MDGWLYWFFVYYSSFIITVFGIYIYSQKELRQKINQKDVWNLFYVMTILRFCDVLSTISFTSKLGIQYEGNVVARLLMTQFGIVSGMLLMFLIFLPLMFFWISSVNFIFDRPEQPSRRFGWKLFKVIIITLNIIVIFINLSA